MGIFINNNCNSENPVIISMGNHGYKWKPQGIDCPCKTKLPYQWMGVVYNTDNTRLSKHKENQFDLEITMSHLGID